MTKTLLFQIIDLDSKYYLTRSEVEFPDTSDSAVSRHRGGPQDNLRSDLWAEVVPVKYGGLEQPAGGDRGLDLVAPGARTHVSLISKNQRFLMCLVVYIVRVYIEGF